LNVSGDAHVIQFGIDRLIGDIKLLRELEGGAWHCSRIRLP
jgi:hypothetical protein